MNTKEFSDQFDVLYNNITSNQAPGLNEYEKSIFLTKAQEEIVKNYFSPKGNPKQDGFDDSPKRQQDFANIIKNKSLEEANTDSKFDNRSVVYRLPSDLFISLNEQFSSEKESLVIVPISYTEYDRLMAKPYKFPPKHQVWRLITNNVYIEPTVTKVSQDYNGGYTLVTASSYEKPVRFIIKATSGYSEEPVIDADPDKDVVTITCVIGKYAQQDSDVTLTNTSKYWNKFVVNGFAPYLEDFKDGTNGLFPAIPIDDEWPLNAVLYDITNPGGFVGGMSTVAELIGVFDSDKFSYNIRYIKRPRPIILTDLKREYGLSIQGETTPMTSELSEELHEEILQRAVELAKIAWAGEPTVIVQSGQRSE